MYVGVWWQFPISKYMHKPAETSESHEIHGDDDDISDQSSTEEEDDGKSETGFSEQNVFLIAVVPLN